MASKFEGMIARFDGDYRWLSNFWRGPVTDFDGITYPATEYLYQCEKTTDEDERDYIRAALTCGDAKRRGQKVTLRSDWNAIRVARMMRITLLKYEQHPDLRHKLISTGSRILVEGNTWNDWFWGAIPRVTANPALPLWGEKSEWAGYNWLGRVLMQARTLYGDS